MKKYQTCIDQPLCKNAKNSQVRGNGEIQKMHRSAVIRKCLKLAVLLSRNYNKNAKSRWSAVKEKYRKVAGPWSWKNAKKSQVRGHTKTRISAVTKNAKYSQVCGHKNCQKCFGQQFAKTYYDLTVLPSIILPKMLISAVL